MLKMFNSTALSRFEILREAEDEGGSGGSFESGGAYQSEPAPTDDRTSQIESRLDRLAQSVEGFINKSQRRETDTQAQQAEQQIRSAESKAKTDIDNAERALAEAFDEGDGATIAKAQRAVAEAAARRERVSVLAADARDRLKQSERRQGGTRTDDGDNPDTKNLDNWKSKHASWYGIDEAMTKAAHSLDASIKAAGAIEIGSVQYYDAIDRQMRQKFPDRFNGTPPSGGSGGGGNGGGSGPRVAMSASVADGLRRMGINVDDPAVAKRMIANREKAVQKGWLPQTPVNGRVITR